MGAKRKRHPLTVEVIRLERTIALALMNVGSMEPNNDTLDRDEKNCALAELVHGLAPRATIWELKKQ